MIGWIQFVALLVIHFLLVIPGAQMMEHRYRKEAKK